MRIKAQRINGLWSLALEIDGVVYLGFETSYRSAQAAARRDYLRRSNR